MDNYFKWRFRSRWVAFANFIHTTLSVIVVLVNVNVDIDVREPAKKFVANYTDEGPMQIIADVWPALIIVVFSTTLFGLGLWATLNLLSATEDWELGANDALKKARNWRNITIFCLVILTTKNVSCVTAWCPIYLIMVVIDISARGLWLTIVYMFIKELETSVGDSGTRMDKSDGTKVYAIED